MMKLTKDQAIELIVAWQEDRAIFSLSQELRDLIKADNTFFVKFNRSVRVLIAGKSKQANEYCWDKKFKSAVLWLMKHGFESSRNAASAEISTLAREVRQNEAAKKCSATMTKQLYESHNRSNQWKVCK